MLGTPHCDTLMWCPLPQSSGRHLAMLETVSLALTEALGSRDATGQKPGILINILQCTGQPVTARSHLATNVSGKVQKPCLQV